MMLLTSIFVGYFISRFLTSLEKTVLSLFILHVVVTVRYFNFIVNYLAQQ